VPNLLSPAFPSSVLTNKNINKLEDQADPKFIHEAISTGEAQKALPEKQFTVELPSSSES
jgi:hypothetical protein